MLTVFKYDTPVALKQRGDIDKLTTVLSKIYAREQVSMRMDEIVVSNSGHTDPDGNAQLKIVQPTYKETFCDPTIRRAAWMGCFLASFQQLTGINAFMFYSSTIFSSGDGSTGGIPANQSTALIGAVNCGAVVVAVFLLKHFGRKSILLYSTLACTVFLVVQGVATI